VFYFAQPKTLFLTEDLTNPNVLKYFFLKYFMDSIPWIIISIAVLLLLFALVFIFLINRKKFPRREPDYYVWFWIGIVWIIIGIPLVISENNFGIFAIGILFAILGLIHKKEWKKNHIKYKDLTPLEKKIKFWVMLILGIFILAFVSWFLI